MKIIIINQHLSDVFGGSEMQCDLIAQGLSGRGHEVIYAAVGRKRRKSYSGIPYTVIPLDIERCGELSRLLELEKPDLIYWRFNKKYLLRAVRETKQRSILFVFAVANLNDVRQFAYQAPGNPSGFLGKVRSLKKIIKEVAESAWNYRAFRYVDALTTLNSQYAGKLPIKKQRVIWNSVINKKKPFAWEKPYCVWVANIKPRKRPEAYLKLASIIGKKCPDMDFLMIGSIQDKQYMPVLESAKKRDNFFYLGFLPPEVVNGALEKAVCLVNTCRPEGFGNNFIQAWMQGCPTVTLEFDPDGLIQRESLGFFSGDVRQMADDVLRLVRQKTLRNEIGERARAFAKANFNPQRMIDEVEDFLADVIKSG